MSHITLLQFESILVSVAIILLFFACLYAYRAWKASTSIMKKIDLVYKKLLDAKP